ncbi:immunoglobulin superfamily DCC subclass member 3 [Crotalus adamanteus]
MERGIRKDPLNCSGKGQACPRDICLARSPTLPPAPAIGGGQAQIGGRLLPPAGIERRSNPLAPPEFVQWPQSLSKTLGTSAIFTCVAQGVPEPHLIWLKNGKVLAPGDNIKLTHNNSTLMIQGITSADEAIYQCIAENSAGTNQASARLAVALSKELPSSPKGVQATALSPTSVRVSWQEPSREVTESIIGYVLHICKAGESDSRELQEAVSKNTFYHVFTNLEPSTTYSIFLKAYSPLGASQDSQPVLATTLGSIPAALSFYTKILNTSTVQVFWELPSTPGRIEGFKLYLRKLPEPLASYEIKLQAFNGNGDGNSSRRFVSLRDDLEKLDANSVCQCRPDGDTSLAGIVVGVHIGMACIIFCVLFLMFGYRKSVFCKKGVRENWAVPQGAELVPTSSQDPHLQPCKMDGRAKPPEMVELAARGAWEFGTSVPNIMKAKDGTAGISQTFYHVPPSVPSSIFGVGGGNTIVPPPLSPKAYFPSSLSSFSLLLPSESFVDAGRCLLSQLVPSAGGGGKIQVSVSSAHPDKLPAASRGFVSAEEVGRAKRKQRDPPWGLPVFSEGPMAEVVPRIPGSIIWSKEGKAGRRSHVPNRCVGNSDFLGRQSREGKNKPRGEYDGQRNWRGGRGSLPPASIGWRDGKDPGSLDLSFGPD